MGADKELYAGILAYLLRGRWDVAQQFQGLLATLPDGTKRRILQDVLKYDQENIAVLLKQDHPINLFTADKILNTEWPEPIWAVPNLLPVGLTILAGKAKLGKSWLALQVSQAVAAGGAVLGQSVESGNVLYMALEDNPKRLQSRMIRQHWPAGLPVQFMPLGKFHEEIGDLRNGGGDKLADLIFANEFRLVVIDTLSRAVSGKQNEVEEMTEWLSPLQEIAHESNTALVLVDHHKKGSGETPDAIADILGSTAKGAMADTALGLYRERGKPGAKLAVVGRDVEEKVLEIRFDPLTGSWQLEVTGANLTNKQADTLDVLKQIGPVGISEIAEAVGRNKGTLFKELANLEEKGLVMKRGQMWEVVNTDN